MKKKGIAFFDFDGTITFKDTLLEIIKFHRGAGRLYAGLLKISPWLLAMKLKIVSNQAAKEQLLTHFFKDLSFEDFQKVCDSFAKIHLPQLIRPTALEKIRQLQKQDIPVVIVSASAENWLKSWCNDYGLICIATQLEKKDNILTGKIAGKNCYGEEKVKRIKEKFNLDDYENIYCFGDTKGDKPMLSLATLGFYKPFRN